MMRYIRLSVLLPVLLLLLSVAVAASGYEFHLLSGMVIKGDLCSFDKGRFYVKTDFGSVTIEPGKLDYIIVNEADGNASGGDGPPGMAVDDQSAAEFVAVPPAPLVAMSITRPLEGHSLNRAGESAPPPPGLFRGFVK